MDVIKEALLSLGVEVRPMAAAPGTKPPYIVYSPDGANDFTAGGRHAEKAVEGTIDLYTKEQFDPLARKIENALDDLAGNQTIAWHMNSVQYETEAGTPESGYTGLTHYEWVYQIGV